MHPSQEPSTSRRQLIFAAAATAVFGLSACAPPSLGQPGNVAPPSPAPARLRLIGEARLPHRLQFQGTTVGGLSGIDYDPAGGQYFLLSDDDSSRNPARFYTARMTLDARHISQPEIVSVTSLRQTDGSPYPAHFLDPESIRWRASSQTLLWTSEGNALAGVAPSLSESRLDGTLVRQFALPAMFDFALTQGPRSNLTFEGLSLTPDGKTAWLSMEGAMLQDGPIPTTQAPGGPCRLTLIDMASGQALRQVAYIPDAIPRPPKPALAPADNGISEILMLDADRMLVLERAYMAGYDSATGNSLRLYLIDARGGSDTLEMPALLAGTYTPVQKTLLADFSTFVGPGASERLDRLDNTEGMTWGPRLPNGNRSLVFISDDNFNQRQITQLLAFEFLMDPS